MKGTPPAPAASLAPARPRTGLGSLPAAWLGPLVAAAAVVAFTTGSTVAQTAPASTSPAAAAPAKPAAPASGPAQRASAAWAALAPAQQQALAPLRPTWDGIDAVRKAKWIDVANRFPRMPADEQRRVQERMVAWAAMSPNERARARVQFQETRRITPEERQARWQAYQALPEGERQRLAQAARRPAAASAGGSAASRPAMAAVPGAVAGNAKRNLVPATTAPAPRSVAPTVVQAKPGVSTTTVATKARPPLHHQHGLPKIVATPNFVDPTTLLPRRGPQAAAMRTVSSADPTQQP